MSLNHYINKLCLINDCFAFLYPSLIAMAKRSFFHFNWTEYGLWMIAHIIFIILMACSISYFSKKNINTYINHVINIDLMFTNIYSLS